MHPSLQFSKIKKSRLALIVSSLLAIITASAFIFLRQPSEPEYQGRPLREWLEQLDTATSRSQYNQAEDAIEIMGTNAVPHLLSLLQTSDSIFKRKIIAFVKKQPKTKINITSESQTFSRVLKAFKILGAKGQCAVPTLIEWIQDPNADLKTYSRATTILYSMGPIAKQAVPTLVENLRNKDPNKARKAADVLGAIKEDAPIVVPALLPLLNHPDASVRGNTIASLTQFGPKAKIAVPALEHALLDTNSNVRNLTMHALRKIAPERDYNADAMKKLLEDKTPQESQPSKDRK